MAAMETPSFLFNFKGCYFASDFITPEYLETIEDFEVRDSDIFVVTYPKSGTVWIRNIMLLIMYEGQRNGTENYTNQVLAIDYNITNKDFTQLPSPRIITAHLPYDLVPKGLKNKKGKVIYVYRNPKDAMVSLFYYFKELGLPEDLEHLMQRFFTGKVLSNSIFDHVKGWYTHKDNLNILIISYEEMIKDLRGVVLKICDFLGKQLSSQEVDKVAKMASFKYMKTDTRGNCEAEIGQLFKKEKVNHLRKGTIGDWKNVMTVSQSERFDKVFQEKMKDVPLKFIWDIKEIQDHD
uniref:Sulfotransferase n=2 Tax=Varanus komodoensis TaxID=61221 RepID=A0A8D2KTK6_VARKO